MSSTPAIEGAPTITTKLQGLIAVYRAWPWLTLLLVTTLLASSAYLHSKQVAAERELLVAYTERGLNVIEQAHYQDYLRHVIRPEQSVLAGFQKQPHFVAFSDPAEGFLNPAKGSPNPVEGSPHLTEGSYQTALAQLSDNGFYRYLERSGPDYMTQADYQRWLALRAPLEQVKKATWPSQRFALNAPLEQPSRLLSMLVIGSEPLLFGLNLVLVACLLVFIERYFGRVYLAFSFVISGLVGGLSLIAFAPSYWVLYSGLSAMLCGLLGISLVLLAYSAVAERGRKHLLAWQVALASAVSAVLLVAVYLAWLPAEYLFAGLMAAVLAASLTYIHCHLLNRQQLSAAQARERLARRQQQDLSPEQRNVLEQAFQALIHFEFERARALFDKAAQNAMPSKVCAQQQYFLSRHHHDSQELMTATNRYAQALLIDGDAYHARLLLQDLQDRLGAQHEQHASKHQPKAKPQAKHLPDQAYLSLLRLFLLQDDLRRAERCFALLLKLESLAEAHRELIKAAGSELYQAFRKQGKHQKAAEYFLYQSA